jgi:hypothetical protein
MRVPDKKQVLQLFGLPFAGFAKELIPHKRLVKQRSPGQLARTQIKVRDN